MELPIVGKVGESDDTGQNDFLIYRLWYIVYTVYGIQVISFDK